MVNNVISGVCSVLKGVSFECEQTQIYIENVPQNFLTPAFTVKLHSQKILPRLLKRSILKCVLEIKYFPLSTVSPNEECGVVLNKAMQSLEFISIGKETIRGEIGAAQIEKGVLSLYAAYDIFYKKDISDEDMMGKYTQVVISKNN